jgi:hypothetical protein
VQHASVVAYSQHCHHLSSSIYFKVVGCRSRFASTLSIRDDSILSSTDTDITLTIRKCILGPSSDEVAI